jgi:hypothetical protein
MGDADYIKQLEKANSKLTEMAAIDRQELEMFEEKYDLIIELLDAHLEDIADNVDKVKIFLSYPPNKKGNVIYSQKSLTEHAHSLSAAAHKIETLKVDIEKIKNGYR